MEVGFSVVPWHCWEPCIIFDKCVVCTCVCIPHLFLSFSSHLCLEWDESLPHYPALHSSMNCEADISFFGGLEGNEWWQHNGIVSTDGKLESWGTHSSSLPSSPVSVRVWASLRGKACMSWIWTFVHSGRALGTWAKCHRGTRGLRGDGGESCANCHSII